MLVVSWEFAAVVRGNIERNDISEVIEIKNRSLRIFSYKPAVDLMPLNLPGPRPLLSIAILDLMGISEPAPTYDSILAPLGLRRSAACLL